MQRILNVTRGLFLFAVALWTSNLQVHAQWITQTNVLRAGWNAVYLHVDASHATLDQLVGSDAFNPIQEIWYWHPALPTGQFIESPQIPSTIGNQWSSWVRSQGPASALQRMVGNGAYLVRVANSASTYNWIVKGKPVTPTYRWTLTGLNFVGFPTPPNPAPFFEAFLAQAPELQQHGEIYLYQGGDLSSSNPFKLFASRTTPVRRDQAYWIRAGETYNQYFGPFQILDASSSGISFGDRLGQSRLRLRNVVANPLTVTLRQVASESAPAGQPAILATPTLLLRSAINSTNLTYDYTNLSSGQQQWTLAPAGQTGSEVEVVIGLNRFAMPGSSGAQFAAVLRFTDSLGLSQVDVGVSAQKSSTAGLWVGAASVNSVNHYLTPYARATNEADFQALLTRLQLSEGANGYHYEWVPGSGRVLVFGGPEQKTGTYLVDGPVKLNAGSVARPFPLRLIVHNDGANSRLLQKVFHGMAPSSNIVLATKENLLLGSQLASAHRISAVHLPTSDANLPWNFTGAMETGGSMSVTVREDYNDQSSNPFLHTYHPDHDNLNAQFNATQAPGVESYEIRRQITLTFTTPANDFDSLTGGSQDLSGNFSEVMTLPGRGTQSRQFNALGMFSLKRISDIANLTTQ
jgi:hypothetical protein